MTGRVYLLSIYVFTYVFLKGIFGAHIGVAISLMIVITLAVIAAWMPLTNVTESWVAVVIN